MVMINGNPLSTQNSRVFYWSQYYTYPYFQQTWALFAPPPSCNYSLIAGFENNGQQKTDVLAEILNKHRSNRLKGYEPLLIALINSIHYFEKKSPLQNNVNGPIINSNDWEVLQKVVLNYLRYTRQGNVTNLKLTLLVSNIKDNHKKIYYN